MIVDDEDGGEFARTDIEEHYTLTDPHNYLTQVTQKKVQVLGGLLSK